MQLANRELLTAGEVPEQQIAARRDDLLGKHYCWLVLLFLFEVDAPGYCQGLLGSLTMVIFVTHPVTVPLSLLAAERAESNGTSC